jgi:hypothetical protein
MEDSNDESNGLKYVAITSPTNQSPSTISNYSNMHNSDITERREEVCQSMALHSIQRLIDQQVFVIPEPVWIIHWGTCSFLCLWLI